jgi:PBP1b-binding outer membrane lipoprotein LpoB
MKKLLFIFAIFLVGCKTPQTITVYKYVVKTDTLSKVVKITSFNTVHDTLTIDNPCDSSGILTSFYSKIRVPQGKVIVRSVRGKIEATVDLDSIAQVYEEKYRSKGETNTYKSDKVVRTNEIPKWAVWFMAISGVLSFLYVREKVSIFVK